MIKTMKNVTDQTPKSTSGEKKVFLFTRIINICLILLCIIGMFVYSVFFPRETESEYDRNLKKFPEFTMESFLSGDYFSDISAYFTDTIHGRDRFKDYASQIEVFYGIKEEEQIFGDPTVPNNPDDSKDEDSSGENNSTGTDSSSGTVSAEQSGETPSEATSSVSDESKEPALDEQLCEGIVILGTRAMELYYGNTDNSRQYAEYLNAFSNDLGGSVNVYSMVIPKSCAYYIDGSKKFSDIWKYTVKDLNAIQETLNGVKNIDVYNTLLNHTEEDIYFRTDHHWTSLGAYYAAQEFAKVAGVPFADLSTYRKEVRSGYVGTMLRYTNNSATLLNNPEDFITFYPAATYKSTFYDQKFEKGFKHDIFFYVKDDNKTSWYLTYLNGDSYVAKIESDQCKNGRKLMILKDSYGNPLAPFLLESFEEIYVVDIREFELNAVKFIKDNGITDALFAVSAYSSSNKNINKYIDELRVK